MLSGDSPRHRAMTRPPTRRVFLNNLAGSLRSSSTGSRRPNILFIMPDQLRAQALGFSGNPDVRTPNIDRLASEGLVFENTFANSPVCCPARANILTGKYAHRNGMVANDLRLRETETTIAEVLSKAGYRTGFVGKWHLDGGPRLPGFIPPGRRRQGFEWWAANECSHAHFENQYFRNEPEPIKMNKFEAEAWTDLALEFLLSVKTDQRPFFLTLQMGPPHDPYKAPPEYSRLYDPATLTMPRNWQSKPGVPGRTELAEYYAMITAVDGQIARLMQALRDLRIDDETIVLLSSDHGDMLGSHGQRLKRKPWEESIRVPGVLRYPRRVRPGRSRALFTHVDFAPTLLGLCGIRKPRGMQGTDLSIDPDGHTAAPESAFLQIFGPFHGDGTPGGWRGVRTARYMYATFETQPWVLYDLENDPWQMNNLVAEPSSKRLKEEMHVRVERWMAQTGDSWKHNWKAPVEDNARLYKHRTFYTVKEYLEWSRLHPELQPPS